MLTVILFISSERFQVLCHSFRAFVKIADFVDVVIVLFLSRMFITTT